MKLEALLVELKNEYIAALPARAQIISQQLTEKNTTELREIFHKMKGSGKTYGVGEVSNVGELGEKICEKFPEKAAIAVPILIELIHEIHRHRSMQQVFDVLADPRFSQAQDLTLS